MGFYDDDPDWATEEDLAYFEDERRLRNRRPECMICAEPIAEDSCFHFASCEGEGYCCERCYEEALRDVNIDLRAPIDAVVREQCYVYTPSEAD